MTSCKECQKDTLPGRSSSSLSRLQQGILLFKETKFGEFPIPLPQILVIVLKEANIKVPYHFLSEIG